MRREDLTPKPCPEPEDTHSDPRIEDAHSRLSLLAPARVWNNVVIALGQIARRPVRNLLVLQGVIWGTALAIFGPGAIEGSRRNAFEDTQTYHLDRIVVSPDAAARTAGPFSLEDLGALSEALGPDRLKHLSPMSVELAQVSGLGSDPWDLHLLGVYPGMADARDFHAARGRYISEADVRDSRPVCVLEPGSALSLFPGKDPLGQNVKVELQDGRSLTLEVVGIMEQRSQKRLTMDALGMSEQKSQELRELLLMAMGIMQAPGEWERNDAAIHVPQSALGEQGAGLAWIYMRVAVLEDLEASANLVAETMTARGRQVQLFFDVSLPFLVGKQLDIYVDLNRAIYLTCVVMGVVVVTILMLAGVLARTHEIGIRMVEGATRGDIAIQFMTESAVMCLAGALVGIPAAFALGHIWLIYELSQFAQFVLPWKETLLTLLLVEGAGMLAGILPAWRAAGLDPVVALRYE